MNSVVKNHSSFLVILVILFYSTMSYGWGPNGHRITAYIADHYLSTASKNEVKKIIGNNSLAYLSTIPDDMRNNPGEFIWSECDCDNCGTKKCICTNCRKSSVTWKESSSWHFVNTDITGTYEEISNDKNHNCFTAIRRAFHILSGSKSTAEEKKNALLWIVHLVGDLHQPLHISNASDFGGNALSVYWHDSKVNLHDVWDVELINSQNLSYTEFGNFLLGESHTTKEIDGIQSGCVFDWLEETRKLARSAYNTNMIHMSGYQTYRYIFDNLPVVKKQLFNGGVRLALTLNSIFDPAYRNKFCMANNK